MIKSNYDKYYKKGGTYVIPVEVFNELFDELDKKDKKDKKDNIINNLEKWLEDVYYGRGEYHMDSDVIGIKDVLNKIKTLKDGVKNEPNE